MQAKSVPPSVFKFRGKDWQGRRVPRRELGCLFARASGLHGGQEGVVTDLDGVNVQDTL